MSSFNKVILLGRLVCDPETRVTPSGFTVAKFGIAVNRRFSTKDGEQREEVTYIDIDAFGRQAEVIGKHLHKGDPIHIEGRLKLEQWENKEGEKRSRLGVVLEGFQFVGGKGGDKKYSDLKSENPKTETRDHGKVIYDAETDDIEEDVPF